MDQVNKTQSLFPIPLLSYRPIMAEWYIRPGVVHTYVSYRPFFSRKCTLVLIFWNTRFEIISSGSHYLHNAKTMLQNKTFLWKEYLLIKTPPPQIIFQAYFILWSVKIIIIIFVMMPMRFFFIRNIPTLCYKYFYIFFFHNYSVIQKRCHFFVCWAIESGWTMYVVESWCAIVL